MESKDQMYVTVHGSNRVELVGKLRAAADNLDGSPADVTGKPAKTTTKPAPKKAADDDEGFVTEEAAGEPEGFDEEPAEEASFDEEEKPAKKAAAPAKGTKKAATKKITLDDVNDACKAHAAAKGRDSTLEILQKKFKLQSVAKLKPEQWESCISAMAVN